MSAVHAARLATDRVPSPEQQRQEMRNAYFSPENHVTPTIPRISPTSLQGEYPQQTADNAVEIIPSSSVVSDSLDSIFTRDEKYVFYLNPAKQRAWSFWVCAHGLVYWRLFTKSTTTDSKAMVNEIEEMGRRLGIIQSQRFKKVLLFDNAAPHRKQSYLYHFAMLAAFCAAAACVALAAVNINRFRDITEKATTCKYQNNAPCYSNHERLIYISTLIGCGGMVVILALTTFLYGAVGQGQMKKRLAEEYKKEAHQRTYENQAFQY
ncbi:unnamed protein product [Heligmosomoides polygyrus]|uniref:Uncharacterized protein n=1 Tax=Heligmosomoides polygyrus TaxID=6339 RepID=A0A3P8BL27_HELPZ|nr:unnamed protein product [Heligmosomoides polygyrus]